MHILFTDDEKDTRELFAIAFRLDNHTCHLAANGAEAIEAIKAQVFDIVVMDVEMPVMDGLTATRHIRELPQTSQPPIILFTAYDYSEQQAIKVGANCLLRKPIMPSRVLQQMKKMIQQN